MEGKYVELMENIGRNLIRNNKKYAKEIANNIRDGKRGWMINLEDNRNDIYIYVKRRGMEIIEEGEL